MNEDLQDEYALIINEIGRRLDAARGKDEQEAVALDAIIQLLANFNLRLSRLEDTRERPPRTP